MKRLRIRTAVMPFACVLLLSITGCAGFFDVRPTTPPVTTPGGGVTPLAGDYVYVVNLAAPSPTLSGFTVGTATLTSVTGSPYTLPSGLLNPSSVVVTRQNSFVYVGGLSEIVCYAIGTNGALTLQPTSGFSALATFSSLDVSPDGQWLLALDASSQTVLVFGINAATGALTLNTSALYTAPANSGTVTPREIRISPNGSFVAVVLGFGGDALFTFNTTTGTPLLASLLPEPAGFSDNAVLFDRNSAFAYFARVGSAGVSGVASYGVTTAGGLTGLQALVASGAAPAALQFDSTGAFLYAANRGDGTITGYAVANGSLTVLSGGPYPSGNAVAGLALDNTGKYVIAVASGGSPDLTLYGFDPVALGGLNSALTAASSPPPAASIAIAATH